MTIQTEVRVRCPHGKCGDVPAMTTPQFFVHLKDNHAVEELRWILTGIEERTDRDNRDHLVRLILRDLFQQRIEGFEDLQRLHLSRTKGLKRPLGLLPNFILGQRSALVPRLSVGFLSNPCSFNVNSRFQMSKKPLLQVAPQPG